jgi:hypothetical protein
MRDELIKLSEQDYRVYGVHSGSYDYTCRVIKNFIEARKRDVDEQFKEENIPAKFADAAVEVESDVRHYTLIEESYLWQLCILRLHGLFELFISEKVLSKSNGGRRGFMAKLAVVRETGFTISDDEVNELERWNKLRNMLTHVPPEGYHPVAVDELDAKEYSDLVTKLSRRREGQRHEA